MSSAAATSLISTPDRLLSFTAVALNRSPYLATLRDPALATTHLQAVSPRCQLIRGNLGVPVGRAVSLQFLLDLHPRRASITPSHTKNVTTNKITPMAKNRPSTRSNAVESPKNR